ncbi:MAG TPA: bifunctional DNA-formamidopyrimidine glycosylase/DNA-(apurinic or apyrimidinic site) lyase [Microbacteriaceae bacterium]|nr:bifunctional DNA-formamidopyrimidine glycosylase/DNA-(apurinic or apyrimidinic site) lyase [Microbacteriaceae bacterium]
MPELPEVEVVRRGLAPFVTGATVSSVEILEPRSLRRHAEGPDDFAGRLTGARLLAPERRGKFLWVPIADADAALLVHLGMSGQVLVNPTADDRHLRVRILLADGSRVDFADQRIFGSLAIDRLMPVPERPSTRSARSGSRMPVPERAAGESKGIPSQVAHIARDPLDPAFSDRDFVRRIRAKRTETKRALLDQTLVSGIGNIYADEALWAARVHPRQPTETLSAVAAGRILAAVRDVMTRALDEGGTSFDELYVNVNGQSGYFSRSLTAYARQDQPCLRCGRPMVRESFMNRGSHYCRNCQRLR